MSELAETQQIRVERIVGVRHVGLGLWWVIILPLMLTIVGIVIAYPLMMNLANANRRSVIQWAEREGRAAFKRFIGSEPQYMDVGGGGVGNDLSALTATGIAYDKGRIYVLEEGVAAQIPWDRIRSRSWRVEGYDRTEIHGRTNLGISYSVRESNVNAAARAYRNSGFTIVTSDIEKREWRFQTIDTKVLQKWEEIFTQMNEGRLTRMYHTLLIGAQCLGMSYRHLTFRTRVMSPAQNPLRSTGTRPYREGANCSE